MSFIVPAVLPASKQDFAEKLGLFAKIPGVSRVQIDLVDGKFATPASWPYTDPEELQNQIEYGGMLPYLDQFEYEIDLMCLSAEKAAQAWLELGATRLTFHVESTTDLPRFLSFARGKYGHVVSFGLALNSATDPVILAASIEEVEYIQCMGIAQIGRQGQPFDRSVIERVRQLHAKYPKTSIQVDGGVSLENAKELVGAGVSNLIVGSSIVRAADPAAAFAALEALETGYGV